MWSLSSSIVRWRNMRHWRHDTDRRKRKYFAWFQASTAKWTRNSLFWVIMRRVVAIPYWPFGTTYQSLVEGTIVCPETSVRNYHYSPRNSEEKHSSQVSTWRKTPTVPFSLVNLTCIGGWWESVLRVGAGNYRLKYGTAIIFRNIICFVYIRQQMLIFGVSFNKYVLLSDNNWCILMRERKYLTRKSVPFFSDK